MSSTAISNLVNVRYYGPNDPYHYSVDNRPLTDLNTNIVSLAGIIDGIIAGNVFFIEDSSTTVNSLESTTSLLPNTGPYDAGQLITIRINNTNTGAVTFTANSGAAYPVHGMAGALQGGELVAGKHYLLSWENSDQVWELVGSSKGNLQVAAAVQSAQAVNLGQLQNGTLNPTFDTVTANGVINAAAGTEGSEVVNFEQLMEGSFVPRFEKIQRSLGRPTANWLPNSSFLYGMAGWQNNGLSSATTFGATYAVYYGTSANIIYTLSDKITARWIQPGGNVNLSGWIYNESSDNPASISVDCYDSSGTFISGVAGSSVAAGESWTYVTNNGTFPSGTDYVEVVLGYSGLSSGGNVAFSELKLENNSFATEWSDEASAQLFQNGQFSPVFSNITASGQTTTGDQTIEGTLTVDGEAVVAPATQSNAAVQLSQLFVGNRKAVFTANGTYTVPDYVGTIWVSGCGGGGGGAGGGGCVSNSNGIGGGGGGGGGAGQSVIKTPISVTGGGLLTIAIGGYGFYGDGGSEAGTDGGSGGAGGSTVLSSSAGSLLTLTGGNGGKGGVGQGSSTNSLAGGGAGGQGGSGYPYGSYGADGNYAGNGGDGASGPFGGGGGRGRAGTGAGVGASYAAGYGSGGGGGGGCYFTTGPGGDGSSGAPGLLIIEW